MQAEEAQKPKPTYLAQRIVQNGRLAYYMTAADIDFWDNHWQTHFDPAVYDWADSGPHLGSFEQPFVKYLPKTGPVLEAGCGLGQYVAALRARGYAVEGVEWGRKTVETVLAARPDLPIRTGDVTRLEVPDGYYHGYISLGVIEHRQEGPEPFLKEAYRVLIPGGVALISVPYIHGLRRMKARLGLYRGRAEGLAFYQYAFNQEEMGAFLRAAGFTVVDTWVYAGFKGVKDEIPLLRWIVGWPFFGRRIQNWLLASRWTEQNLGHMIMFVCRKA